MITDSHVHIGWFSNGYHSPKEVWKDIREAGIDRIAVSSTSSCADLYSLVCREMRTIIRLAPNSVAPILWLTSHLLSFPKQLKKMVNARGIDWAGVKIHPVSHPQILQNKQLLNRLLEIVRALGVPMLIHTGEYPNCHAGVFEPLCRGNENVNFVLAHGRPLNKTIEIMKSCPNVYTDTAFMPLENIHHLISCGLRERILFGSDVPINKLYYPQYSTCEYLRRKIAAIKDISPCVLSNNVFFR